MLLDYSKPHHKAFLIIALPFLFYITSLNSYAEDQPVMGAGPSTVVAKLFFEHFSSLSVDQNYQFNVEPRSIKHAGGIKASDRFLFGRTGRPLNNKEKMLNKHDLFLARIPLSFVVGKKSGIKRINLDQLEAIYSRKITNWKELGGADANIFLVGRETTEAAYSVIRQELPYLRQVEFDLILTRDHQLINLLNSSKGDYALGFGAKPNFEDSQLLPVEGFNSGVSLGLVYDTKNRDNPVVKAAIQFANSPEWHRIVVEHGFLPPQA